ncbi:MAG: Bax inhibitor-1/YccA family protein, partial [Nitrospinota bacterium]
MNQYNISSDAKVTLVNSYVRSVYNWMAIGLSVTGFIAFYVSTSQSMINMIFGNSAILIMLIIAELGLVFYLSGMINKIQASTATNLFLLYSALNGITLSSIFLVYTRTSIFNTFFICAATFGAFSLYGWTTKKDLTSLGGFFMMGLF